MMYSTAYTVLVVGLASQILAEPYEPHQPSLARMSTRNIIGFHRRDLEGYAPTEQICGDGNTCAEACGKGFTQCNSKDHLTHCYNPVKKETCCPNGSGESCDNGYFCTADDDDKTWCCPDGLSLKECAQKYNIPGPLTSQAVSTSTTTTKATATKETTSKASHTSATKEATTKEASTMHHTSTKESSTTKTTSTTSTTSTKSKKPESTESAESTESTESTTLSRTSHHQSTSETRVKEETSTTSNSPVSTTTPIETSDASISPAAIPTQTTTSDAVPTSTPPASTTSSASVGGSGSHGPANSLVLVLAGALAAFV
ncbi:hypothetical protein F4678DRAFT_343512 [Xylaria arbuscula]|nr:hypothetical protein F4678DRAFT_343512 [Xylaria arbuscula]